MLHTLGYILISLPFIGLAGLTLKEAGIKGFLIVFGGCALLIALLYCGLWLLSL